MSRRCIVTFLLWTVGTHFASAADNLLSSSDVSQIKRVCRRAIGYPVAKSYQLWSPLTPFLRSKGELDQFNVTCSSDHCSGSILLRDNTEVWYTYVHVPPQHSKLGTGDLTADVEYKGNNRFVSVELVRHRKVLLSRSDI
jgi:hypothetical protein